MALWFKKKNKAGNGSGEEKMSDDKKGTERVSDQMEHGTPGDSEPEDTQIEDKSDRASNTENVGVSDETYDKPVEQKQGLFSN